MSDPARAETTRCAIYTRKSSEEGLQQDFNSLHAQREACEAYVVSQKHEGWRALPTRYDDGGYSGGSMERPGLQKLLADIASGQIDVVVVYKVDRLTRSLTDFARMVEVFDRQGVSFVSVTQAFNTTTSMGRLTLNVLLSFAQFEREVTGERIRDKIAASKKKGLWMGGFVPVGYDANGRTLVINGVEADTVRSIYRLYLQIRSVDRLKEELDASGVRTKLRSGKSNRMGGGCAFSRGHLYRILANPPYVGEIEHKGQRYPGQHPAIVDRETWEAVQAQFRANGTERQVRSRAKEPSLLADLLVDEQGVKLTSTHAVKNGKRYRYYVSRKNAAGSAWRLPAYEIESAVTSELRALCTDQERISVALEAFGLSPDQLRTAFVRAESAAERLCGTTAEQRQALLELVRMTRVRPGALAIDIVAAALVGVLGDSPDPSGGCILLQVPRPSQQRSAENRIVIPGGENGSRVDPALIKAIARGHAWFEQLATGRAGTITEIAARENVTDRYVSALLKLAFLSPGYVEDALGGRAMRVSANLMRTEFTVPLLWSEHAGTASDELGRSGAGHGRGTRFSFDHSAT